MLIEWICPLQLITMCISEPHFLFKVDFYNDWNGWGAGPAPYQIIACDNNNMHVWNHQPIAEAVPLSTVLYSSIIGTNCLYF